MAKPTSNVERFLGPDAARGGPFALLGVPAQAPDAASVVAALESRLAEVNAHAHSETPQADEVRLALHAAAAQLLDPVVRRHMVERWGSDASSSSASPSASRPVPMASSEALALEHDAILTLGMYGGWNRASLRRIAVLAHARGVPSHRVADAIRAIAHRRTPASIAPEPSTPEPTARAHPASGTPAGRLAQPSSSHATNGASHRSPAARVSRKPPEIEPMLEDEQDEQGDGGIKLVLGIMLGVVIAAVSLLGVLSIMWESKNDPTNTGDQIAQTEPAPPQNQGERPPPDPDPAPDPSEPAPMLPIPEAMERAREALAIDPDQGVREIGAIIDRVALAWVQMPSDQRTRIHADIVDLLYRVSPRAEHAGELTQRIARGAHAFAEATRPSADDITRGAWSSGMLVRLTRESNLPMSAAAVIDATIAQTYAGARPPQDATFDHGVLDFLAKVPHSMLDWPNDDDAPRKAWTAWLAAGGAISFASEPPSALLLAGLDQILREGPEPTRRAWPLTVSEQIVDALPWDDASPARAWLVSAFNAPALTSADLFAITSALSKRRDIEGVDPTMTLDAQASERARAELRDRYASAWGLLDTTQSDDVIADLRDAFARARREAQTALTREEHLASTARLAMLNEAASWIWRGEIDEALATIDDIDTKIDNATQSTRAAGRGLSEQDSSQWAVRYLSVRRNQQARLELLDTLSRRSSTSTLDTMDAEVLVREAIRGDRGVVRRRAHDLVRQFMFQAPVVNALLEELPDAPETHTNARLISDAAGIRTLDPTEPNWRIEARRGLVERLLELVAGESPEASIDRLSTVIARAYALRASTSLDADPDAGLSAEGAALELRLRWRRRAANVLSTASLSLDRIERERLGRVSSSRGPVQNFAAEQLATCELMAYVVIGERAGVSEEVRSVLQAMEVRRQGARHIFEQLAAVESAMGELWLIRLRD